MGTKIILAVCFVPVAFLMFGILYFEGKRKGNILLGVTLWPEAEQDGRVQAVREGYRRQMWGWLAVCLALYAASCLPRYEAVAVSLQMLWVLLVMVIFFVPHVRGNRKLKEIKGEWMQSRPRTDPEGELWEQRQERHVDVTAAAQDPPRPFWKTGFAGGLLGLVPVVGELFLARDSFYGWWTEIALLSMALGGLALLWIMWHFWRMRTDVVSRHSEVNQQVARVRQYQWGRFWCLAVWENSVLVFALWYGMHRPQRLFWITVAGVLVITLVLMVQMIYTERNIRRAYEAFADSTYWEDDEDAHWLGGILYYNEKDQRFLVNKRVGVGTTVNLAKTSGKIFMGAGCAVTVAALLWAAILILAYEFVPISLDAEDGAVVSRQFGEEYRIPLEEMEEAELCRELPPMSKRVGSNTDTLLKGRFMGKDYSSYKVCARKNKPPFLRIVTKDGTVYFLNDEEGEKTEAVYEQIWKR